MPYQIVMYVLLFLLAEHSFLNPPHRLPALELDYDFVGVDDLDQVEEDLPLDGVPCEVERLIDLNERARHDA